MRSGFDRAVLGLSIVGELDIYQKTMKGSIEVAIGETLAWEFRTQNRKAATMRRGKVIGPTWPSRDRMQSFSLTRSSEEH